MAAAVWQGNLVWGIFAGVLLNSVFVFIFYREDMFSAQYKDWRIPQKCLHIRELFGEWSETLHAQQKYRHKRCPAPFKIVFQLRVLVN